MTTLPAPQPHEPASRFFTSQRLRLHYADWGNETAPPLLLLHGGLDHCRSWDCLARRLQPEWHVIAPDLRGHGDSEWVNTGSYGMDGFVYDLAELIHHQARAPITLIGHSLGGNIALRYTGVFPETVRRVVSIEGLGPSPAIEKKLAERAIAERMAAWVAEVRRLAGRAPRRYPTLDEALARMQAENPRLTNDQAAHLTRHAVRQNADGTYSWKFDNAMRAWPPHDMARDDIRALWARITCPTLLIYGSESWASNPAQDGRATHFKNARVELIQGAGHWIHHDRPDAVMALLNTFLP
jgi:pimeloyl-ACP methyl ester carboxylesterase